MKGWIELHETEALRPMFVKVVEVGAVEHTGPYSSRVYTPCFPYGKQVRESRDEVLALIAAEAAE